MRNPEYLGDGVYIEYRPGIGFKLMANDHMYPTDTIYLEPGVLKNLISWAKRMLEPQTTNRTGPSKPQNPDQP